MHNQYGDKLEHVLHEPSQECRDDVIIIIGHGLTGHMDRELYCSLAEGLASKGWRTLRFSFSGHGKSEGKFEEMTISKEVDDLESVISCHPYLIDHPQAKVVYIGHSMGAAVGALAALKNDRIKILVSLAGITHTREFYDQEFADQKAGASVMWEKEECPLSQAFQDDLYEINSILPLMSEGIATPWLLIHGGRDDVVLPNHSEDLCSLLSSTRSSTIKYVTYEDETHQFESSQTQITLEIDEWIQAHL